MRSPVNQFFSFKYCLYVIFGALGLLDHGCPSESDMV